jgi:hypothetical protein
MQIFPSFMSILTQAYMCIRCGRNWQARKITASQVCFHTSQCFPLFHFLLLSILLPDCVRIRRSLNSPNCLSIYPLSLFQCIVTFFFFLIPSCRIYRFANFYIVKITLIVVPVLFHPFGFLCVDLSNLI